LVAGETKSNCSECKERHGELSITCDKDQTLTCESGVGKTISLFNGVCYDCSLFDENGDDCNDKGPTSCIPGFYLEMNETSGIGTCEYC
jgi:hypothetical protein